MTIKEINEIVSKHERIALKFQDNGEVILGRLKKRKVRNKNKYNYIFIAERWLNKENK